MNWKIKKLQDLLTIVVGIAIPIIALVIALCSLIVTTEALRVTEKALKETQKARRDPFLPIILADGITLDNFNKQASMDYRNIGRGVALNVHIDLEGFVKKHPILRPDPDKAYRWSIYEEKPNDSLKIMQEIDKMKKLKKITCVISYYDIFKRQIRTVYEGTYRQRFYNDILYTVIDFDTEKFDYELP